MYIAFIFRVSKFINGDWTQIGSDIVGEPKSEFGFAVSLSSNGDIVAIGAPYWISGGRKGRVYVYENVSGNWVQVGSSVDVIFRGSPKRSVAISSDGNLMAVGGPGAPNPGSGLGYVKVYSHINGALVQIGSDIIGPSPGRYFGFELSFSDDGKTLLVSEANSCKSIYIFKWGLG